LAGGDEEGNDKNKEEEFVFHNLFYLLIRLESLNRG
jgi:hypothetical protein